MAENVIGNIKPRNLTLSTGISLALFIGVMPLIFYGGEMYNRLHVVEGKQIETTVDMKDITNELKNISRDLRTIVTNHDLRIDRLENKK